MNQNKFGKTRQAKNKLLVCLRDFSLDCLRKGKKLFIKTCGKEEDAAYITDLG
jgi:hypothetical protein